MGRPLNLEPTLAQLAAEQGLPPVVPATGLYRLLIDAPTSPGRPVVADTARVQAAWLGEPLAGWATQILTAGRRVAQEHAGYERLAADPGWCQTGSGPA